MNNEKILTTGIVIGLFPLAYLIFSQGIDILFQIKFWVHWGWIVFYGISMLYIGVQLLIVNHGGVDNLMKMQFKDITYSNKQPTKKERNLHQKNLLPIAAIVVGASTLLLMLA